MARAINVGVVGCGYWGPNLIRNFRALPDCRLKSMCDLSDQRLNHLGALYRDVGIQKDFKQLLADPELDAIVVSTPVGQHYRMAKASLEAGKHTFVEKPLARSTAECEELIALAQQQGLILMVGHTFLYSPAVRRMKDMVDKGMVGKLQYISANRSNLGLFQKDINVTWDLAPHDISIVLYLMEQMPVSVNCLGNAHVTAGVQDVTNMALTFENGCFAVIQSSWLSPRKVREMTAVGSKKMIVYDDMEPCEKLKVYDTRVDAPPHYDTFAEFQYSYHHGDRFVPHFKQEEPLKVECQHFLDCIKEQSTPLSDGVKGLQLVQILEAASASLEQQGASVSLAKPTVPLPTCVPELELVEVA
ncbi:MAG TPA: Gfo/Idh/MocA family oxidoreductase [Candidatus Saccharimonadales bacterium]|nr:Gfo/Idh/MocA family oxidoreductase [Candidatus Saccharimonadales bacterium]